MFDNVRPYFPQLAAALAIIVGGSGGAMAALETGQMLRWFGTAVFLAITVALYAWRFHFER